jgi:hypothetical protein
MSSKTNTLISESAQKITETITQTSHSSIIELLNSNAKISIAVARQLRALGLKQNVIVDLLKTINLQVNKISSGESNTQQDLVGKNNFNIQDINFDGD